MILDDKTFSLSPKNYIVTETVKRQIVLGHTGNLIPQNYGKWVNRYNGKYNKTAAFSIQKSGIVFKHFEPYYCSTYFNNIDLDKKSIVILLENEGWLNKDSESQKFLNWIGNIYNNPEEIVIKLWRKYMYWSPYTEEQFHATLELVKMLCDEFFIPRTVPQHNTKIDDLSGYTGILYKSNIDKTCTELSPAWNYELFKNKLETYE